MNKDEIFNKVSELEFVLTTLSWGDSLQPGEIETARDTAREILEKLHEEGYCLS